MLHADAATFRFFRLLGGLGAGSSQAGIICPETGANKAHPQRSSCAAAGSAASAVRHLEGGEVAAGSYFLFGSRGTGKSTWLRARYPDAETERHRASPERLAVPGLLPLTGTRPYRGSAAARTAGAVGQRTCPAPCSQKTLIYS